MRRFALLVLSSVVLVAMLQTTATARSLTVRSDPNDTPGALDIRKVWTDLSGGAVFVKVGNWTRIRNLGRFSVLLDTKGSRDFDRIIEISIGDTGGCAVQKVQGGFLGDFIGKRDARRPSKRTIACQLPAGWFHIGRTVRFVVFTGVAGEDHADRAPDERRFIGL